MLSVLRMDLLCHGVISSTHALRFTIFPLFNLDSFRAVTVLFTPPRLKLPNFKQNLNFLFLFNSHLFKCRVSPLDIFHTHQPLRPALKSQAFGFTTPNPPIVVFILSANAFCFHDPPNQSTQSLIHLSKFLREDNFWTLLKARSYLHLKQV